MDMPHISAEDKSDRSKKIGSGLGIASLINGFLWVVTIILQFAEVIPVFWRTFGVPFYLIGFVGCIVGLALGIAGNVLNRRSIAFSIAGITVNSMLIGFTISIFSMLQFVE